MLTLISFCLLESLMKWTNEGSASWQTGSVNGRIFHVWVLDFLESLQRENKPQPA
jgi:hypothetical protein